MSGDGEWGKADVLALMTKSPATDPMIETGTIPDGFRLTRERVEYRTDKHRDGQGSWLRLCSPLSVEAVSRSGDGDSWGRLLLITDPDGVVREWVMPMSLLAGGGNALVTALLERGLVMIPNPANLQKLVEYIAGCQPRHQLVLASKTGWQNGQFVLPGRTVGGADSGMDLILQNDPALAALYEARGTLESWRHGVSRLAAGNSRLVFAASASFAAPLLHPLALESGGFHLRGGSSTGKSTALRAAGSIWGGPRYIHRWRATDNGLEAIAAQHNDTLLALDEIGQLDPRSAGQAGYLLANGSGKHRSRKDGTARPAASWRTLFLSTGEVGLAERMAETGRRQAAGMSVRVLDIPADAGKDMGILENLHGVESAGQFADLLQQNAARSCGTAGPAFVAAFCRGMDAAIAALEADIRAFREDVSGPADDGQVQRAAHRFALAGAAGELAIRFGIVDWEPGEAIGAARRCYRDWLAERGTSGPAEVQQAVKSLRTLIDRDGASRFQQWYKEEHPKPVHNRAGFIKHVQGSDGVEDDTVEYYILPSIWTQEITRQGDLRVINKALVEKGILVPDKQGKTSGTHRPPSNGASTKLYQISLMAWVDPAGQF